MTSILFLSRWYPPRSGHFIKSIAEAVSKYFDVAVLVAEPSEDQVPAGSGFSFIDETSLHIPTLRVRYRQLSQKFPGARILNTLSYIAAQAQGMRYLRKQGFSFDIYHVHVLTRTAVIPAIMKILTGKPFVVTEYWTRYLPEAGSETGWFHSLITRLISRQADTMVAISGYLKKEMEVQGFRNSGFNVIPPAIDTRLFRPVATTTHGKRKRIIHISNFSERAKNISGILRTLKKLTVVRTDFECQFIGGTDATFEETYGIAKELGLSCDTVFFTRPLFGEDLARAIGQADFLLMFSWYETFSVVIQECLASGKPVVASATGPIPELVDTGSGILVPPGDEEALLIALDQMLDKYGEYAPRELHKRVNEMFGFQVTADRHRSLYEQVLLKQNER